ncbi:MAG TPA: hypothetical protein VNT32_10455 [Thermoleophilaceae bacterium]|nr:hypothetical protein [Thermoleophilaceae bacterium]
MLKARASRFLPPALAAITLAGCGGSSGDVLAIQVSGGGATRHEIVVANDGRGRCDRGELRRIEDGRLVDAREIATEVADLAQNGESFGEEATGARQAYVLRTTDGTVRWVEATRGLPDPLPRAELLAVALRRELCGE